MVPRETSRLVSKLDYSIKSVFSSPTTPPNSVIVAFHQGEYLGVLDPSQLTPSERLFGRYSFFAVSLESRQTAVEVNLESKSPSHLFHVQAEIEWQLDKHALDTFVNWGSPYFDEGNLESKIQESFLARIQNILEPIARQYHIVRDDDALDAFSEAVESEDWTDLGLSVMLTAITVQIDELAQQHKSTVTQSHSDSISLFIPTRREEIGIQVTVEYTYRIEELDRFMGLGAKPEDLHTQLDQQIEQQLERVSRSVGERFHVTEEKEIRQEFSEDVTAVDYAGLGIVMERIDVSTSLDDEAKDYRDSLLQRHPVSVAFPLQTKNPVYSFQVGAEYAYRIKDPEKILGWRPEELKNRLEGEVESHLKTHLRPIARKYEVDELVQAEEEMVAKVHGLDVSSLGLVLERLGLQLSLDEAALAHKRARIESELEHQRRSDELRRAFELQTMGRKHYLEFLVDLPEGLKQRFALLLTEGEGNLENVFEMINVQKDELYARDKSERDDVFQKQLRVLDEFEKYLSKAETQADWETIKKDFISVIREVDRLAISDSQLRRLVSSISKESTDIEAQGNS